MCLIIVKPANIEVPDYLLAQCIEDNPHGWGAMYAENGQIHVEKDLEMGNLGTFIEENVDKELHIHVRYRTHGKIDIDNCHPYRVTDDIWMMHNGIIDIETKHEPDMSDTAIFVRDVLRPVVQHNPQLMHSEAFRFLVEMSVGRNRLTFLNSDGTSVLVNEYEGKYHKGLWLSNTNSLPKPPGSMTRWQERQSESAWSKWSGYKPSYASTSTNKGDCGIVKTQAEIYKMEELAKMDALDAWDRIDEEIRLKNEADAKANAQAELFDDLGDDEFLDDDELNDDIYPQTSLISNISIEQLSRFSYDELMTYCFDFPEEVADALHDHFLEEFAQSGLS